MKTVNDRYVIFSIILVVFLFLSVTQTLTSGYHFIDDHEIVRIKHDLKEAPLFGVINTWVKEDMHVTARFRPLYFANRVFITSIFGSDFFFWSLYNGLLWCIVLILFYMGIRNLRFNITESLIFLVISFIGPQSEIWWRLGPQESLGVVFLSLAFYSLSLSANGKRYHLNNILFALSLILASLCKESFILIIPAFIILKIWYERIILKEPVKETIVKNLILLIPLFVTLLELIYIKYRIGTEYSGLNNEPGIVINNIWHTCLSFVKTYLNLVIAGVILLVTGLIIKRRIFWFDLPGLVFFLLIIIPNILLYARSGLTDRYLLPTTIGLGFFIVSCIKDIADNSLLYRKATYAVLLLSFLPHLIGAVNDASKFATDGQETNKLLSAVYENYEDGSLVLVVVDPVESYEKSVSLKTYLLYEYGTDLYGYCMIPEGDNADIQGYVEGWKSYFTGMLYDNMISRPGMLIFLDSRLVDRFFQSGPLQVAEYEPVESGSYTYSVFKEKSN